MVYPFANLPGMARFHSGRLPSSLGITGDRANVKIIEVNEEPTPLTHEGISDYLIQGKTGEILPMIVKEAKKARFKL